MGSDRINLANAMVGGMTVSCRLIGALMAAGATEQDIADLSAQLENGSTPTALSEQFVGAAEGLLAHVRSERARYASAPLFSDSDSKPLSVSASRHCSGRCAACVGVAETCASCKH